MILESWYALESSINVNKAGENSEQAKFVKAKLPKRVKKRRKIQNTNNEGDENEGWEEYYDYLFPDDQA